MIELRIEDKVDLLGYCAKENNKEFNFNKSLEEASEYSEALLKYQTKADSNPNKPDKEDILGEYGDFVYRGLIALKTLHPELSFHALIKKVNSHIERKISRLEEWKESGLYTNGL